MIILSVNEKEISVWDVSKPSLNTFSKNSLWNKNPKESTYEYVSIDEIVHAYREDLRCWLINWIEDLGRVSERDLASESNDEYSKSNHYFWFTQLGKKDTLKDENSYLEILRLRALFIFIMEKRIQRVNLFSENSLLINTMQKLFKSTEVQIYVHSHLARRLLHRTKSRFRTVKRDFFELYRLFKSTLTRFQGYTLNNPSPAKHQSTDIVIVDYFMNFDLEAASWGEYRSGYWGNLINELIEKGYTIYFKHIFFPSAMIKDKSEALNVLKILNRLGPSNVRHDFINTGASVVGALKKIREARELWRLNVKNLKLGVELNVSLESLWPVIRRNFMSFSSYLEFINEFLSINEFKHDSQLYEKANVCIYLHEGQSWEQNLAQHWREVSRGKLLGVVNGIIPFWYLKPIHSFDAWLSSSKYQLSFPDVLAVCDEITLKNLTTSGCPESVIEIVEPIRWADLLTRNASNAKSTVKECRRILFVDEALGKRDVEFQIMIREVARLRPDIEIIYKPHPTAIQKRNLLEGFNVKITKSPLTSLLDWADLTVCASSTSAIVDVMVTNKKVLAYWPQNRLCWSPALQFDSSLIVRTADDLIMKADELQDDKIKYNNVFLTPDFVGLPKWLALIKKNNMNNS